MQKLNKVNKVVYEVKHSLLQKPIWYNFFFIFIRI